jgi:hypothetical protein
MYERLFGHLRSRQPESLRVLEIAPGNDKSPWRQFDFAEYRHVDYPDFDICRDQLDAKFDIIIADQVFEHILWPYRAVKNVHAMLKPNGQFIVTTPFLIKIHANPIDCSRWTETGMKHLLAEGGFSLDKIETGAWGNLQCVVGNLRGSNWVPYGWGKPMQNQPEFPIVIWAIAQA